jgi:hypothetical protein
MMANSLGGFNGLQIAARRPPALKAIVTICSTDDRCADDAHYMGGTLLTAGLEWASYFFASMCLPPDPILVGTVFGNVVTIKGTLQFGTNPESSEAVNQYARYGRANHRRYP